MFNVMFKFNYSKYNSRCLIFGGGLIYVRSFPFQKLVPKRPGAYTRRGLLSEFYGMLIFFFYQTAISTKEPIALNSTFNYSKLMLVVLTLETIDRPSSVPHVKLRCKHCENIVLEIMSLHIL